MEWSIILLQQPGFSHSPTFHQSRSLHRLQVILSRLLVRVYVATSVFRHKAVPSFELYPLIVAAFLRGKEWSTSNIVVYCNNEATVHCINKKRSHSPAMMPLIRLLIWIAACNQFIITAKHVPGSKNQITDFLARFSFQKFRQLASEADPNPTPVPQYSELIFS